MKEPQKGWMCFPSKKPIRNSTQTIAKITQRNFSPQWKIFLLHHKITQMRKRKSTIRRIGSLKRTPSVKAFQCPKEFCGFLTSTADKLAVHVDRVHGAYHDLLSPHSPELAPKTQKSSIYEAKRLSDIMWGTMAAGKIFMTLLRLLLLGEWCRACCCMS